ncbi:ATP-binding protein [Litorisediminicola beolgyonensis]|uniref:histidine kinase n=1 Tax=Litorisediminicola beolgyonensis TaxID=1173614 RepID=A0ABW3ZH62_9RHOB
MTEKFGARVASPSRSALALTGLVCGVGGAGALLVFLGGAHLAAAMVSAATVLLVIWALGRVFLRRDQRLGMDLAASLIAEDSTAALICDEAGTVLDTNAQARRDYDIEEGGSLPILLRPYLAAPGQVLHRVEQGLRTASSTSAEVELRDGPLRISLQRLPAGLRLWRFARVDAAAASQDALPTITLGRNDVVLSMNAAARDLIGRRLRALSDLIPKGPVLSGKAQQVLTRNGVESFVIGIFETGPGRREMTLLPASPDQGESEFDTLPIALLRLNPDGAILRANREAQTLLAASEIAGAPLSQFMEGLGRSIPDWLAEAAAGRALNHSEFLRLTRDDREVFVQVTLSRIFEQGETVLIAVLNDATELKSLEAQFVQSQKMQAIGQLAGGVAHDFNNLLTAISGHCDLLLLRHDSGDPDFGDLVQINQNANRAAALVGQLLAFSRKQTLRPEVLDLRDTLSDLAHLLNRLVGERVRLELTHDPALPNIRGDRRQLEQVLMNLVVNARDAMTDGGVIAVETDRVVLTEPLKRDRAVVAPGSYVRVRVTDHGVGIPRDKLQKVFEPFFTTKRQGEGTGLGLSTVYGIIKQTGGFIFVDSEVGKGTCFQLLIPVYEGQIDAAPKPELEAPRPIQASGDGVIMLVEDEAPVRAFASRALKLRGYTVIEADCAEAALAILEDAGVEVDLFVSDVIMPGLDGPSWVRKAREQRPDIGVVFVSGYAEDALDNAAHQMPNASFLAKPFSLNDLTDTVAARLS